MKTLKVKRTRRDVAI